MELCRSKSGSLTQIRSLIYGYLPLIGCLWVPSMGIVCCGSLILYGCCLITMWVYGFLCLNAVAALYGPLIWVLFVCCGHGVLFVTLAALRMCLCWTWVLSKSQVTCSTLCQVSGYVEFTSVDECQDIHNT